MYEYRARVVRVVDGDTIDFDVDLGFSVRKLVRVRLARVDAYEVRGEEREKGLVATSFVKDQMPLHKEVVLRTDKDKKGGFGRYIAEVDFEHEGEQFNLGDLLLENGHAVLYEG